MNRFGRTYAAFAIAGLAIFSNVTLSAADAEAKVTALNPDKKTVTVSSPVIEPDGTAVVKVTKMPANLKVGDAVVVRWNREASAFVLVSPKQ
ncbi:MAG: hypothetical protein H0W78_10825 [Planctomycetes bacterium]|nr:hypothetical protein [Planctomycetota bacterium]